MKVLSQSLVLWVALSHLGFMVLEMYFWNKPIGLKIFRITQEFADQTKSLAANQGLYNGFLALGLIWSLLMADPLMAFYLKIFFLGCVFIAGLFGAYSASKNILFIQALPALITIIIVILDY